MSMVYTKNKPALSFELLEKIIIRGHFFDANALRLPSFHDLATKAMRKSILYFHEKRAFGKPPGADELFRIYKTSLEAQKRHICVQPHSPAVESTFQQCVLSYQGETEASNSMVRSMLEKYIAANSDVSREFVGQYFRFDLDNGQGVRGHYEFIVPDRGIFTIGKYVEPPYDVRLTVYKLAYYKAHGEVLPTFAHEIDFENGEIYEREVVINGERAKEVLELLEDAARQIPKNPDFPPTAP